MNVRWVNYLIRYDLEMTTKTIKPLKLVWRHVARTTIEMHLVQTDELWRSTLCAWSWSKAAPLIETDYLCLPNHRFLLSSPADWSWQSLRSACHSAFRCERRNWSITDDSSKRCRTLCKYGILFPIKAGLHSSPRTEKGVQLHIMLDSTTGICCYVGIVFRRSLFSASRHYDWALIWRLWCTCTQRI